MVISEMAHTLLGAVAGLNPLVPYYHAVGDEPLPHIRRLHPLKSERQFVEDIDFLGRNYRPLSLEDLISITRNRERPRRRGFILTFDDGYRQVYSVIAPLLYKKGLPAIFFLTSDFIDNRRMGYRNKASLLIDVLSRPNVGEGARAALCERLKVPPEELIRRILAVPYREAALLDEMGERVGVDFGLYLRTERPYLSRSEVCSLVNMGFAVGAHSLDHPYFGELPLAEQLRQAKESLEFVRNAFRGPHALFAFPHSDLFVDERFFREINGDVDLTFGTSGLLREPIATNIQRINFEDPRLSASAKLARIMVKKALFGWRPSQRIDRRIRA